MYEANHNVQPFQYEMLWPMKDLIQFMCKI